MNPFPTRRASLNQGCGCSQRPSGVLLRGRVHSSSRCSTYANRGFRSCRGVDRSFCGRFGRWLLLGCRERCLRGASDISGWPAAGSRGIDRSGHHPAEKGAEAPPGTWSCRWFSHGRSISVVSPLNVCSGSMAAQSVWLKPRRPIHGLDSDANSGRRYAVPRKGFEITLGVSADGSL